MRWSFTIFPFTPAVPAGHLAVRAKDIGGAENVVKGKFRNRNIQNAAAGSARPDVFGCVCRRKGVVYKNVI
jgi:hypothetical protein